MSSPLGSEGWRRRMVTGEYGSHRRDASKNIRGKPLMKPPGKHGPKVDIAPSKASKTSSGNVRLRGLNREAIRTYRYMFGQASTAIPGGMLHAASGPAGNGPCPSCHEAQWQSQF